MKRVNVVLGREIVDVPEVLRHRDVVRARRAGESQLDWHGSQAVVSGLMQIAPAAESGVRDNRDRSGCC